MRFDETAVEGVRLVASEPTRDERGSFERVFCTETFAEAGLAPCNTQWSLSRNLRKGTLRGLHYQAAPNSESKLVRCVRGAIFDVAADIRAGSPTFGKVVTAELTAGGATALYIPPGVAHGFLTLEPDSDVLYGISPAFVADGARGVRWDDPTLAVPWPFAPKVISERDRSLPLVNG